jgi:predicted metalloendopeptidase
MQWMQAGYSLPAMSQVPSLDSSNFDAAVPPGEDFFRFANGGWLDANPVPPEYGSWGSFREVHVRNEALLHSLLTAAGSAADDESSAAIAGRYFASGMDIATIDAVGTDPLIEWLDRIRSIDSLEDLRTVAARLHPLGAGVLFGMYVAPDFEDSDRYLLYISQGGLGLPERDYYLRDDDRSSELRDLYVAHITAQLENLGDPHDEAAESAAAIFGFETALAEYSYTAAQLRDVDLTTNKYTREELAAVMPAFDLVAYLDEIDADGATSVNLNNPGFFTQLDGLLRETPIEVLRAYGRWNLIRSTASALPAVFQEESFEFYGKALGGEQQQKDRWKRVLAAATGEIGESVSRLYIDAAFGSAAKVRCEEMVDGLVSAMGRSIRSLSWMSEETKAEALTKLAGFTYKIGYPDKWKGTAGLQIDDGPWVQNRLRARAYEFAREIAKLAGPVDDTEWAMPAHVVNAYYHPIRNEIVFPAGILQPPFFYADADDAVNYGAIGAVIGHEITHGFDDQGSRFDAEGHLRNWWTDEDRKEFERRADVVVDQFDSYAVADDLNINGRLTLGENIADLGGVAIAFDALINTLDGHPRGEIDCYTPEQRFFLSYGTIWRQNYTDEYLRLLVNTDPHAPSMFRCNGALANSPAFAEAFGLTGDDPMVRPDADRAEIW